MTNIKIHTTLLALLTLFALTVCNVAWGAAAQRHRIVFVSDGLKFPGGENAMMEWIDAHLIRPTDANGDIVKGKVAFVLDEDGSISEITVVNSVHPLLDNEAKRVIGLMPRWNPGILDGKPVRVKYSVPVTFKMR